MLPDVLSHELYCIYDGGTENLMLKGKSLQVIIQVFYLGGFLSFIVIYVGYFGWLRFYYVQGLGFNFN